MHGVRGVHKVHRVPKAPHRTPRTLNSVKLGISPEAGVAQLVEQLIRNQQVVGSSPTAGSNECNKLQAYRTLRARALLCAGLAFRHSAIDAASVAPDVEVDCQRNVFHEIDFANQALGPAENPAGGVTSTGRRPAATRTPFGAVASTPVYDE